MRSKEAKVADPTADFLLRKTKSALRLFTRGVRAKSVYDGAGNGGRVSAAVSIHPGYNEKPASVVVRVLREKDHLSLRRVATKLVQQLGLQEDQYKLFHPEARGELQLAFVIYPAQ